MTMTRFSTTLVLLAAMAVPAMAQSGRAMPVDGVTTEFDHGGGCRKSSPRGQCCHMETKKGRVHCH